MNQVEILGRLVKTPELRQTRTGTDVCSLTIAVPREYAREGQPGTDFFDCVAWDKTGVNISKYFSKSQRILIRGRLHQQRWTDEAGDKRSKVDITVTGFDFIEPKDKSGVEPEHMYTGSVSQSDFIDLEDDDGDLPF